MHTHNNTSERRGIFYGWIVLAAAFVILVLGFAIRNTFSVFYPAIVEEFSWSRGNTAVMFSLTILIYGLSAPIAGSLVDRFSPKAVFAMGGGIMGIGLALCSLATAQWQFYLLYGVVVAIGFSLAGWGPVSAIISNWFAARRGLAYGILAAGFGGSLVSASFAQFLISTFGWQIAYIIMGILAGCVIVPLALFAVYGHPEDKGLTSDDRPQISNGAGQEREEQWRTTTWTLRRALKTHQFWLLFLIGFCLLGLAEQIAIAHQVYFLRDIGYTPGMAAGIYSVFGCVFVVGTLCSYFSDRVGREGVFIPSCILAAVGTSLLFLMEDASQPWMAFLFAVCLGLGLGAAGPVFYSTVADLFQGRYFGSIQGTVVFGFSLGGAIAPWLAGFLYDSTHSYFIAFVILLISFIASALLMWAVAPRRVRKVSGKTLHNASARYTVYR
ncbi:MAG: MFS transporter [Dehalococcoidia bacterium]